MVKKYYTLNPEFPGYWSKKESPENVKKMRKIDVVTTILIFGFVSLEVLYNLSVVTVASLVIASVSTIFLLLNYEKYPLITVPLSQFTVLLLVGYIHLVITNSLTIIKLTPEPVNILLGIFITIRMFIGMYIIRMHLHYSKARIPVSKNIQESLHIFESHLKLTETRKNIFSQEQIPNLFTYFRNIIGIFIVLGVLLIPLWLNMFFNVLIYPYIILIPSILLLLLILMIYFQRGIAKN